MQKYSANDAAQFPRIGCVIMASGEGRRFGGNKLMADLHGRPMVQWIMDSARNIFGRMIVVTRSDDVRALCEDLQVSVLQHPLPHRSDTVRLGLESIMTGLDGCMFCPGDQPLLTADSLVALASEFEMHLGSICRLCWGDTPGTPVVFPQWAFEALLDLPDGCGGSSIIKKHTAQLRCVAAQYEYELWDVDTPDDFARISAQCEQRT